MTQEISITEVSNVWTVYGVNEDGTAASEPIAALARPQDWGHPRWRYERFLFQWDSSDKRYINHVHCWTDMPIEKAEMPVLFASLIVQILMPGTIPQWCDKEYLRPDDFWDNAWGPLPALYDPDDEDAYPFEDEHADEHADEDEG